MPDVVGVLAYITIILLILCASTALIGGSIYVTRRQRLLSIRGWLLRAWLLLLLVPVIALMAPMLLYVFGPTVLAPSMYRFFVDNVVQFSVLTGLFSFGVLVVFHRMLAARILVRPLRQVHDAVAALARGEHAIELPTTHLREIAELAQACAVLGTSLALAAGNAKALERERELFVGAIMHDLRNPLFTMRAYLQGLEQGLATTPEKTTRYVRSCQDQLERVDQLVADLLLLHRLNYVEQPARYEQVDLAEVVLAALENGRQRAEAKGVTVAGDGHGPCIVHGDSQLLLRAFENLLMNAIRETPSGTLVEVSWTCDEGVCSFHILDRGPGFAPDEIPYLLDPYREGGKRAAVSEVGLGLTIAQRILQAHGGYISAGNRADGGAHVGGVIPVG